MFFESGMILHISLFVPYRMLTAASEQGLLNRDDFRFLETGAAGHNNVINDGTW